MDSNILKEFPPPPSYYKLFAESEHALHPPSLRTIMSQNPNFTIFGSEPKPVCLF